jgi:hypothetical protein
VAGLYLAGTVVAEHPAALHPLHRELPRARRQDRACPHRRLAACPRRCGRAHPAGLRGVTKRTNTQSEAPPGVLALLVAPGVARGHKPFISPM